MATIVDCKECGNPFVRIPARGRPAVKCPPCKEKVATVTQFSQKVDTTTGTGSLATVTASDQSNVVMVDCKECGVPFERVPARGRPAVRCAACKGKQNTVMQFSKNNGATGTMEKVELKIEEVDGVVWIENSEPCTECGKTFMRPRKRGKPPTKCPDCKAWAEAEKAAVNTTSDEKLEELFDGDKALLKGTPNEIPKGAEAQCPAPRGCGRIFTSDSACEDHKVYGPNGNLASCKDPASLGMEPRKRRDIPVWTRPTKEIK